MKRARSSLGQVPLDHVSLGQAALTSIIVAALLGSPTPIQADVPSLQVAPLQYEATLTAGRVSSGVIDVSNPADTSVKLTSEVDGFRQVGQNGDLEFFNDPDLSAAIKPGLDNFTLGPREAVRVVFSVDASKLPQGGTYAAVFFRTTPPEQTSNNSFISESAKVGTLLILTNGQGATHHGQVVDLQVPLWQVGDTISGKFGFQNTDQSARPIGFKPQLTARVMPWGQRQPTPTGLVLPGTTRNFSFTRTGAFFGIVPLTITDADTQSHATVWVVACTGWYRSLSGLAVVLIALSAFRRLRQRPHPADNDETAEKFAVL